jgi:SAM-dependent methyltransferase
MTTTQNTATHNTARQLWALGDYDRIADLLADLGRAVVAAADVGPGMRVLDIGSGTGNAALPAAAAGADVVATDVTPELLAIGERHARDRGLTLRWEAADAQALPFADGEFDAVLSSIGAIFAPDHAATARELLRVCRPGGIVVMANWTPDGGVGRFFELLGRYESEVGDGPPPTAWGVPAYVAALLDGAEVRTEIRRVRLAFSGPPDALAAYYRRHFPPVIAAAAGLDDAQADRLERELAEFFAAEAKGAGASRRASEERTAPGSRPSGAEAKGAGASRRASEERTAPGSRPSGAEAKGAGASRRASGPTAPGSRPSDAENRCPVGGPPCYELEYLLVVARAPIRPGR